MSRTVFLALLCGLFTTALAGTRVRYEEGQKLRQVRLAAAYRHSCAVIDDGTVRCWGENGTGQVGDGTTTTPRKIPVTVLQGSNFLLTSVTSITTGANHSCAARVDGSVFCWGDNTYGQLGTGNTTPSSYAVQVHNLVNIVAISAGNNFSCALRSDGTVWCWGINNFEQLGALQPLDTPALTPVQVRFLEGPAIAITSGFSHSCALLSGGQAECWGDNSFLQIGGGISDPTRSTTYVLKSGTFLSNPVPLDRIIDLAAGQNHTCALIVDGTARCWGSGQSGDLGNNSTTILGIASDAVLGSNFLPLTNIAALSAGATHTCAIIANGGTQCWGDDQMGELGNGTTTFAAQPVAVPVVGLGSTVEIAAATGYTCAIEAVNWIPRCWGDNTHGQLGNGTVSPTSVPSTVSGVAGSIGARNVHASDHGNCARRGTGIASCWGSGVVGTLGNGSFSNSPSAVNVSNLNDVISISAGYQHVCAVRATGAVVCWGAGQNGQLGNGLSTNSDVPVTASGITNALQVTTGNGTSCAVLADSTVRCWGYNGFGEIGQSSFANYPTPATVAGLSGVMMISSGHAHTCAVLVDGTARCWGDNNNGELGDGKVHVPSSRTPVQVLGINNAIAISAGGPPIEGTETFGGFTCVVTAGGGAKCWGRNTHGQLGDSGTSDESVPDVVTGMTNAVSIATSHGGSHSCAVLGDGSAACWGKNDSLQLGAKDSAEYHAPTPVIKNFSTINGILFAFRLSLVGGISAGAGHTCAVEGYGGIYCWGDNNLGQIGNGTSSSTDAARPTVVNSFTANVTPAVTLRPAGRIALVTALINCQAGEAHISLTLDQDSASGSGSAVTPCLGGQAEVEMRIPAQGPTGFQVGLATASVEAVVKDRGNVIEDQRWIRVVQIAPQP